MLPRTLSAALLLLAFTAAASAQTTRPALPPGGEAAAEALEKSPRHGEWVEIKDDDDEDDDDPAIKAWVVYPERAENAPVIIVIHEIYGMTDWVRGVADALAAEGFIAVAPDLLSGMGPDGGGTDSFEQGPHTRAAAVLPTRVQVAVVLSPSMRRATWWSTSMTPWTIRTWIPTPGTSATPLSRPERFASISLPFPSPPASR